MKGDFKWNAVELCAGGGGMSTGIMQAGFEVLAAAEIDLDQAAVYARNHPSVKLLQGQAGDIRTLTGRRLLEAAGLKKGELNVLAGGIPCQGFSLNGKRNASDPRNNLWEHVPRLAKETGAQAVVVENVVGMLSLDGGRFVQGLIRGLEDLGYTTSILQLNAADYGVPQQRKRIFIVGSVFKINHPPKQSSFTVWDALRDLPQADPGDNDSALAYRAPPSKYAEKLRSATGTVQDCGTVQHADFLVDRFTTIRQGQRDEPTRHRRLYARRPAYTVLAGAKTITACRPIHPFRNRVLTVREGARLFGFPDEYRFAPTVQKSWYALGNSVPPPLARAVFSQLKQTLCR